MSSALSTTEAIRSHRHVLASRNFRFLWLGQAISTFGDKFTEIAIPIFVYNLTGSAMQLGFAFLVQTVAALVFGLFAGVMTDRWNRQRTMIGTDVMRAVFIFAIILIPILPLSLEGQLILLYSLGFLAAAVKQFFMPAKVAVIPETVEESQLVAANSLDQSTMTLVGFFGFAAAGLAVERLGVQTAVIVDSSTFIISAIFIALIRLPKQAVLPEETDEKPAILAGIKAGIGFVWDKPILKGTVLLSLMAPLAVGATQALLLIFSQNVLQAGAFGFGLLEGTFGLGIAVGAYLLARFAVDMPRGKLLAVGVVGMGIGQLLAVAIPLAVTAVFELPTAVMMALSLPFFFLGAACNAAVFIGIRTIIQENAPHEMMGRVFSVIMVVSSVAIAIGASLAGLADLFGVSRMLLFWSLVLVLSGLAALRWKTFQET